MLADAIKHPNGILMYIGDPISTHWYREGRQATREGVLESINTGLPLLEEIAKKDGPEAQKELAHCVEESMKLVPE